MRGSSRGEQSDSATYARPQGRMEHNNTHTRSETSGANTGGLQLPKKLRVVQERNPDAACTCYAR